MTIEQPAPVLYINGERVPEQLVAQEAERLATLPNFARIADPAIRHQQIVGTALIGAVDRILVKQESEKDTSPVAESEIATELERICASGTCGPVTNPSLLRPQAETQARFTRAVRKLIGISRPPEYLEIKSFFDANQSMFLFPERVESAHVLKNVDRGRSEPEARRQIALALEELDGGADFADVARRHSDCPENGGAIGAFARGEGLIPEFERVIFGLSPGQHSGIFRSGFGYHIAKTLAKYPPVPPHSRKWNLTSDAS